MSSRGAHRSSRTSGGRGPAPLFAIGRVAAPVVALVLLTILPSAATAAPVQDPAVEQYVESVPGARGDGPDRTPSGSGGGLPAQVQRQVEREGGADAGALEAVASSAELGAPATAAKKRRHGQSAGLRRAGDPSPSAIDAVGSAALGEHGSSGGWVLLGIALLTAALAATALARRSLTR
jgi:hypothetical protein